MWVWGLNVSLASRRAHSGYKVRAYTPTNSRVMTVLNGSWFLLMLLDNKSLSEKYYGKRIR